MPRWPETMGVKILKEDKKQITRKNMHLPSISSVAFCLIFMGSLNSCYRHVLMVSSLNDMGHDKRRQSSLIVGVKEKAQYNVRIVRQSCFLETIFRAGL